RCRCHGRTSRTGRSPTRRGCRRGPLPPTDGIARRQRPHQPPRARRLAAGASLPPPDRRASHCRRAPRPAPAPPPRPVSVPDPAHGSLPPVLGPAFVSPASSNLALLCHYPVSKTRFYHRVSLQAVCSSSLNGVAFEGPTSDC